MRPPAPSTPMRKVSFAPSTRVDANAVSPPAIRKLRRSGGYFMPPILAIPSQRGKRRAEPFAHSPLHAPKKFVIPLAQRNEGCEAEGPVFSPSSLRGSVNSAPLRYPFLPFSKRSQSQKVSQTKSCLTSQPKVYFPQ